MLDEREEYEEYLKRAAVIKAAEEWDEPIFQNAESYKGTGFGIIGFLVIFYLLDKAVSFLIKAEMVVRHYFKEIMSFLNWIFGYIHFFNIS